MIFSPVNGMTKDVSFLKDGMNVVYASISKQCDNLLKLWVFAINSAISLVNQFHNKAFH